MKPEALKLLQDAVVKLDWINKDAETIEAVKCYAEEALKNIRAALFMETPSPSMKFNIYDFTNDDGGIRPQMGCVHHEDGFKVASDCHLLIAVKDAYPEDLEGKNINRKGEEYEGNYPKWKMVFPSEKQDAEAQDYRIDFDQIAGWVKENKAERKMLGKWGARTAFVKVGPAFFKLELFARFVKFMKAEGTDILRIIDSRRAAACYAENGSKGLMMPAFVDETKIDPDRQVIWQAA